MDKILYYIKKIIPVKVFKLFQPAYHFLLNFLAAILFNRPSNKIIVIGVTGTTGKTTSVYLIAKTLEAAGLKVGYTSTAMFNDGEKEWLNEKKMTMIGRFFTQKIIKRMVKNGCHVAIVETTSEGIVQYRHRFINYDILVFTGLYPEHIESHGSFSNYKKSKQKLFKHLKKCQRKYLDDESRVVQGVKTGLMKTDLKQFKKTVVVNGNDEHAADFLKFWAEQKYVYFEDKNDKVIDLKNLVIIKYSGMEISAAGTSFRVGDEKIKLQLLGEFNVTNAMNAVGVALAMELEWDKIKKGLQSIPGVAGRLERIDEGQDYTIIVDYAFEPKAVIKLYETAKLIPHEKIIHVLGSTGGGRDTARRPKLGELAGRNADIVIVTNEDPYDDDPGVIIDQVALGSEKVGKKEKVNLFKVLDRRDGIKKALSIAKSGDLVLITGKGSEQAICVAKGEKITWDDRGVVRGLLKEDKEE
jgi:UDP-N-acetylmuramoyl-L-alanyl-D-glutamate--2,6-diaminopimelate ligase